MEPIIYNVGFAVRQRGCIRAIAVLALWYLMPQLVAHRAASKASSEIYEAQLRSMSDNLIELRKNIADTASQISELTSTNHTLTRTNAKLERYIENLNNTLKQKDAEIERLRTTIEARS